MQSRTRSFKLEPTQTRRTQCGVHVQTICNFEQDKSTPSHRTLDKISGAFELAGIELVDGGIREAENLTILHGHAGFETFLDDVYDTARRHGTKQKPCEIFITNAVHVYWLECMGEQKWKKHVERMVAIKEQMDIRIIVKEKDFFFPAQSYAQYRWFPDDLFNNRAFYSYHNKLAFLNFKQDDVTVTIMRQSEFADGYRTLFKIAWNHVAIKPEEQDA